MQYTFLSIHLSLVFVFSSFSNIPKLNLAYGLTPALLLAPTKTHVRIRELYKAGYSRQFRYYDDFGLSLVVFSTLYLTPPK